MPNIHQLVELFYSSVDHLAEFHAVSANQTPEPYRQLLNHNHHMTVVVEQYYGEPVDVRVLDLRDSAEHYSRKIVLTRCSDQYIVQFGIVRLRLDFLPLDLALQIRAARVPLGRILIDNQVMREVTLTQLWQFQPRGELAALFGDEHRQADTARFTYGRTAMIHVDGEPAVELLEVLAPIV